MLRPWWACFCVSCFQGRRLQYNQVCTAHAWRSVKRKALSTEHTSLNYFLSSLQSQWACYTKWKAVEWEAQTGMRPCSTLIHLRKLPWVHCPGNAGVKGNDRADRLVGNWSNRQKWLASRLGSEVLRSLRHYLQAQSQRLVSHTHTSIAWRRKTWKEETLDDFSWKDSRRDYWDGEHWNCFRRQRLGSFWETFIRSFCLMSSDAKSILGTTEKRGGVRSDSITITVDWAWNTNLLTYLRVMERMRAFPSA